MTGWTTVVTVASSFALAVAVVALVLLRPDADGTGGLVLGVAFNAALICFAASLFAAFLGRR
jgi:hypothetical protein